MKRLYQLVNEATFPRCECEHKYKKLLFALCYFHSLLLERRKFLMLGWNVIYGFNDSDFEVRRGGGVLNPKWMVSWKVCVYVGGGGGGLLHLNMVGFMESMCARMYVYC